jgi:uncharacterized protein
MEFIVKVHSRCDLSCDYCYMYEMADQSWRDQQCVISPGTVHPAARRIGEHARAHRLPGITLIRTAASLLGAGRPRPAEDRLPAAARHLGGPPGRTANLSDKPYTDWLIEVFQHLVPHSDPAIASSPGWPG